MWVELSAELVPVSDLRPLPGLAPPSTELVAKLIASVKKHGVLEPLLVRPARNTYVLQEGRRGRQRQKWGWFLIDTSKVVGHAYQGDPPFYATQRAAKAAMPADVPFEVVRGMGRLAAMRALHRRFVPCVIQNLTDNQVEVLRRFA
jgi:ParB-like chromosome segregation protein Spo0J